MAYSAVSRSCKPASDALCRAHPVKGERQGRCFRRLVKVRQSSLTQSAFCRRRAPRPAFARWLGPRRRHLQSVRSASTTSDRLNPVTHTGSCLPACPGESVLSAHRPCPALLFLIIGGFAQLAPQEAVDRQGGAHQTRSWVTQTPFGAASADVNQVRGQIGFRRTGAAAAIARAGGATPTRFTRTPSVASS